MKKYLPNCLSVANLIAGAIGTVLALNGHLVYASYAIFVGALFDFFDGLAARLLHANSSMGKQLDSLADMVTFGMAPASILYMLIKHYETCPYRPYAALFVVVFAALRLAGFNVEQSSLTSFKGMPLPAYAILVATLPMFIYPLKPSLLVAWLAKPLMLVGIAMVVSWLLISSFPFITLKFSTFCFQGNQLKYILLILSTLLVACMQFEGLFCSIWLYILLSLSSKGK